VNNKRGLLQAWSSIRRLLKRRKVPRWARFSCHRHLNHRPPYRRRSLTSDPTKRLLITRLRLST